MKIHNRLLYIIIAVLISVMTFGVTDNYAATKKTKTTATAKKKTTASTKKQTTSAAKKKTASTAKKTTTAKRKTSSKKTTRKKTTAKKKTTKPEVKRPEEIPQNDSLTLLVNSGILEWIPEQMNPGGLRVNSVKADKGSRTAKIFLNENFTYLPVTKELIKDLTDEAERLLPDSLNGYHLSLMVVDKPLSYFITTIDKLPESSRKNPP